MSGEKIQRVGVVGLGQMGAGIAEVCARAHTEVLAFEPTSRLTEAGRQRVRGSLDRGVSRGKITENERDQALGRLRFTTDLGDFADRDLVIEAVVENEKVKTSVFTELDKVVAHPQAVLASNTSSLPIMRIAAATTAPGRVIGLHFFNPVPVLPLVELVATLETAPEIADRAHAFAADTLGKNVVRATDRSGFVVNALLVPYLLAAIRMVEAGFATREDIDKAIVAGLAHPMGPLELADLIGLDTLASIAEALYVEFKQPHDAPPSLLMRMVEAGRLGRKTGRGFYHYDAEGKRA